MKKRFISMLGTMTMLCLLIAGNVLGVSAQDKGKIVDGSYLIEAEESRGTVSEEVLLKGKHLMDGESAISKSGRGRIYAYGATTADHDVDYLAVLVFVDQYNEETGDWEQIYAWAKEAENTYYVSTGKTLQVPRGYYYRVHCTHYAGNVDDLPYDEAISFTDGIKVD